MAALPTNHTGVHLIRGLGPGWAGGAVDGSVGGHVVGGGVGSWAVLEDVTEETDPRPRVAVGRDTYPVVPRHRFLLSAAPALSALILAVAPAPAGAFASAEASGGYDATCRKKPQKHVLREYFRGPARYTLRCGTKKYGWKHIKARHGWSATMDRKINTAITSGEPNDARGFSTWSAQCPSEEVFRTVIGTPVATNDLLTAYRIDGRSGAKKPGSC